ncbi:unnamed protein product, partial [Ilex paraguariensis]
VFLVQYLAISDYNYWLKSQKRPMVRKKPNGRGDENLAAMQGGGGKSKKKSMPIDDDEYSIGTELYGELSFRKRKRCQLVIKKKGKKGSLKSSGTKE